MSFENDKKDQKKILYKFKAFISLFFYCCSSTIVSIFTSPCPPTLPIPTSHPRAYPLWLCPCVLYTCSLMTLPLFPPIIPLPLPSGYILLPVSRWTEALTLCRDQRSESHQMPWRRASALNCLRINLFWVCILMFKVPWAKIRVYSSWCTEDK